MVRQEMADVLLFPMPGKDKKNRVFCIVVSRPYDMDRLVDKVSAAFWQQAANGKNKKALGRSYRSLV
jgi:hypothetical protein